MEKEIEEMKKIYNYSDANEFYFASDIVEGCGYDISNIGFDLLEVIAAIFNYGQVIGIRKERKRRGAKA